MYRQLIPQQDGQVACDFEATHTPPAKTALVHAQGATWLITPIHPVPHLLVVGGGVVPDRLYP
ncbi:hypothetical protein [Magnetococcus sp. PR-3]|uniref:hypothetical protein n=1 Tax=Magnetococcus sp. PR-3 TaxID=3120355 RepID=UPI002FCE2AC5